MSVLPPIQQLSGSEDEGPAPAPKPKLKPTPKTKAKSLPKKKVAKPSSPGGEPAPEELKSESAPAPEEEKPSQGKTKAIW